MATTIITEKEFVEACKRSDRGEQEPPFTPASGSASLRRYATSTVLCKRLDGWNNDIQIRLGYFDAPNEDEAKGRAVTDAMTNNPGYSLLVVGVLDVTQNREVSQDAGRKDNDAK